MIRPAQDCSAGYGGAVVFRRILRLDERDYDEETVACLGPTWAPGLSATHTYNADERFELVDGRRAIPRRRTRRAARAET